MKLFAAMLVSVVMCGVASAAPMSIETETNQALSADVIETAGNSHGVGISRQNENEGGGGGGTNSAVPEPASMALLGIGIAAALLRRRK
jgi:hypothetical protein